MEPQCWWGAENKRIATGFDRFLLFEFEALEEHHLFALNSLSHAIESLDNKVRSDLYANNERDREAFENFICDEYMTIHEVLPRILWNAQFLVVYATFEHVLNELCLIVQRRSKLELSFKDLSGNGIERAKNYLSKVAGVKEPFQTPAWQRAMTLGQIRNVIAHKNGEIDVPSNNKNCLGARLASEKNLELKKTLPEQEDAKIMLSGDFVKSSISELKEVLISVCNYELYDERN